MRVMLMLLRRDEFLDALGDGSGFGEFTLAGEVEQIAETSVGREDAAAVAGFLEVRTVTVDDRFLEFRFAFRRNEFELK